MNIPIVAAFAAYFSILITIGFIVHKRSRTESDFVLGDRSVNYWVTALSAHASDMSAWLFMAFPAAIFMGGLAQSWIAIGLFTGMFLNWQFVATRLRIETESHDSYTLSTFFEKKFKDSSGAIRILTALMTIVFLTCYLSAGLIAIGFLFESLFGINFYVGICFATAAVALYTLFGGFVTVAWVDFFQGTFLLFVIVAVPLIALSYVDGFHSIAAMASMKNIPMTFFHDGSWTSLASALCLSFGWGLGYFGQPHIITKFMGIKSADEIYKSKYVGMTWLFIALTSSLCIGLVGIAFFSNGLVNSELVFVEMVKEMFHPFVVGFVLCAVLAANISTMDSQILVCASVLTEDIYKGMLGKRATSERLLFLSRLGVVGISLISLIIAFTKSSTVAKTVFFAWSGLGCTFGPLVIMSLYVKRVNKWGALTGIIVGGLTAFVWPYLNPYVVNFFIPSLVPGFALGCFSIYFVSRCTRNA